MSIWCRVSERLWCFGCCQWKAGWMDDSTTYWFGKIFSILCFNLGWTTWILRLTTVIKAGNLLRFDSKRACHSENQTFTKMDETKCKFKKIRRFLSKGSPQVEWIIIGQSTLHALMIDALSWQRLDENELSEKTNLNQPINQSN